MRLINKRVKDTLEPLQIPVSFNGYSGKETTYITFNEYFQAGEEFEEDAEYFTGHYIQLDIWSKTDYMDLARDVKLLLIAAGFKRLNEADFYEAGTGIYHKGIRFYFLESKEVD